VKTSATPRGWTPVTFRDAQFSIPHNWAVVQDDVPLCGEVDGDGTVFLGARTLRLPDGDLCIGATRNEVLASSFSPRSPHPSTRSIEVNGIAVDKVIHPLRSGSINSVSVDYLAPSLGVELRGRGPKARQVLSTLTHSPLAVVTSSAPHSATPNAWKTVNAGGISMSVPPSWTVRHAGFFCGGMTSSTVYLLHADETYAISCPAIGIAAEHQELGVPSAAILSGRQTSSFARAKTTRLLTINGLTLHVLSSSETGHILTASIDVLGHASPTVVELGLPGDGLQARAILDSIHLSRVGS
jgi:hypothetical protein